MIVDSAFLGSALMVVILLLVGVLISRTKLPAAVKVFLVVGLGARLAGAWARQTIAADARVYFQWGERYAEYFARFDLAPLFDPALWRSAGWVGTNAVAYPAGFAIAVLGPAWYGVFLVYTLLAFAGVVAYGLAFRANAPGGGPTSYWAWLMLFPSLVFWPSSIGKEALMMLGLGITAFGFLRREESASWWLVATGLLIVYAIRPQVAAIAALAIVLTYTLRPQGMGPLRVIESTLILGVGLVVMWAALESSDVGGADLESIEEYVVESNRRSQQGGSEIGAAGFGLSSVPVAAVNVLLRPFPWEATSLTTAVSALEVLLLWGLVVMKRRQLWAALRRWRTTRLTRYALLFAVLYVIGLGMNLGNLGIIARQRVLVFPLLFVLIQAGAVWVPRAQPVLFPQHSPVPGAPTSPA